MPSTAASDVEPILDVLTPSTLSASGSDSNANAPVLGPGLTWILRAITRRKFEGLLPQAAVRQLLWVQLVIFICISACLLGLGIQTASVVDGVLIARSEPLPSGCTVLNYWLVCYCVFVLAVPFGPSCHGFPIFLVAMVILSGKVIRAHLAGGCRTAAPRHWDYVDEVCRWGLLTMECVIAVNLLGWFLEARLTRIQHQWTPDGPARQEVIDRIMVRRVPERAPDAECSICLGQGSLLSNWRVLSCGHHFHEHCLLEWLHRAHKCPLCRLDLNSAYVAE